MLLAIAVACWQIDFDTLFSGRYRQTLTFYLTQADSLKTGTPVRLMGVDIGVVKKVRLLTARYGDNRVMIEIQTQPDAPELPPHTRATVQFYGLAGGKSIDLVVDPIKKGESFQTTLRMRDFQKTQNDLALALIEGSRVTQRVFDSSKALADPQGTLSRLNSFLTRWTGSVSLAQWRVEAAQGKLPKTITQWQTVVNDAQKVSQVTGQLTNPATLSPAIEAVSRYTQIGLAETHTALQQYQLGVEAIKDPLHHVSQFLQDKNTSKNLSLNPCLSSRQGDLNMASLSHSRLMFAQCTTHFSQRQRRLPEALTGEEACCSPLSWTQSGQYSGQPSWQQSWQQFNEALVKANRSF
ncbi:MAG: MlaD family protein [Vampirovibrionales bacterium]|nr:MlaD family protein [Vampirovibrionales bacterium]